VQDSASRQAVQVLDKEIDRLDAVVKRFLEFHAPHGHPAGSHATRRALERSPGDCAAAIAKNPIFNLPQLLPIDVPEVYVDRALLKQAVLNLVLKRAEAMPNGGQMRLVLSRRGEMAENYRGRYRERNSAGTLAEDFSIVFHDAARRSGIGLASAFRIVQLHNGSIDFTSEVGRGTTFRIELHSRPNHDGKSDPGPRLHCHTAFSVQALFSSLVLRLAGWMQHAEAARHPWATAIQVRPVNPPQAVTGKNDPRGSSPRLAS